MKSKIYQVFKENIFPLNFSLISYTEYWVVLHRPETVLDIENIAMGQRGKTALTHVLSPGRNKCTQNNVKQRLVQ